MSFLARLPKKLAKLLGNRSVKHLDFLTKDSILSFVYLDTRDQQRRIK